MATLGLLIAVTGCVHQVDIAAEEAALRAADAEWLKAFKEKDVEGMVSFYAETASVFPPNAPIVTGREAIRQMWTESVANTSFALSWESTKVEMAQSGELAWVQETYEFTMQGPEGTLQEDRGKAVLVWKKQADGNWKAVADIFNSDLPCPCPHPAEAAE
jgi:uncharacterized protein (TIGR02246 family)